MATLNVETAVSNATRDMNYLGECRKMLVSPLLFEAFRNRLEMYAMYNYMADKAPVPKSGEIYFKGVPVAKCDQLQDLEYSFVK